MISQDVPTTYDWGRATYSPENNTFLLSDANQVIPALSPEQCAAILNDYTQKDPPIKASAEWSYKRISWTFEGPARSINTGRNGEVLSFFEWMFKKNHHPEHTTQAEYNKAYQPFREHYLVSFCPSNETLLLLLSVIALYTGYSQEHRLETDTTVILL